jgi:hypothetical protein
MRILFLLLMPGPMILASTPAPPLAETATFEDGVLPLPKAMQEVADMFIDQDAEGNPLPAGLNGEREIIRWIAPQLSYHGTRIEIFEQYRHRGHLLLTFRVGPWQKRGDPNNLGHMLLVNLKRHTCRGILMSRT